MEKKIRGRPKKNIYMPKVSFVITIYNKKRYLDRTLSALKAQEGLFEKEYIFIDDCSTDNSIDVIKGLTFGWKNDIILHKMEKNSGVCKATKKGIELATGDYIKFLDGDDVLFPDATNDLLYSAIRNNVPCATFRSAIETVKGLIDKDFPTIREVTGTDYVYRKPLKSALEGNSCFYASSRMLVKTDIAKKYAFALDTDIRAYQDYILGLYIAKDYDIIFCDFFGCYEWDYDCDKLSYNGKIISYNDDTISLSKLCEVVIEFMKNSDLNKYEFEWCYNFVIKHTRSNIHKIYKNNRSYKFAKLFDKRFKIYKSKNKTIQNLLDYVELYKNKKGVK